MKKNNPAMNSLDAKYPLAGTLFFAIELPIIKIIRSFIEKHFIQWYITTEGVSTVKSKNEQYQRFKFWQLVFTVPGWKEAGAFSPSERVVGHFSFHGGNQSDTARQKPELFDWKNGSYK